ncbi:hypothetical protein N7476_005165 [Penicillium atrosanguineum]|uniref:RNA binding protein Nrd1 n=1 Tax=Penicillium atrosanguineum TaxID=1132637 RepID=A0A9W9U5W2_9EURO|nr:hypothetical protein N7476_005165 [Penicillium atrosanguineum]
MSSAVAELENYLRSMLALKPPGVSGSKIQSITTLCTANVQQESVLIQKIFTHFKKAPGTHKLGVLYVVDSVTRQWIEAARQAGQPPGNAAPDDTFAAGVDRVTEFLPVLMTDIIKNAPNDQEEKIRKLIDIWERGQTFPAPMLSSFREQLTAPPPVEPTTSKGSLAADLNYLGGQAAPANNSAAAPDTSFLLKALADMATATTGAPTLPQANPYGAPGAMAANPFAAMGVFGQNPMRQAQSQSNTSNPLTSAQNPLAAMMPQQLQLLRLLASQGIPQGQWGAAIQIYNMTKQMGSANPGQMPSRERDLNALLANIAAVLILRGGTADAGLPPRRAVVTALAMGTTVMPADAVEMNLIDPNLPPPGSKLIEWDYSIGQGNIKVLSRTLFVGGVTSTESQLRNLFSKLGNVQTCIVNRDKRHAFIKMTRRQGAVSARDGMASCRTGDMQLCTRWGVGFGPRDCNDYQTGVSVIPIERLTEADRRWMRTAEYGGTGGRSLEPGMVVEEPDIEIGAGVSSKAISRRIATDTGGQRGPQSSRGPLTTERFGGGSGGGSPARLRRYQRSFE